MSYPLLGILGGTFDPVHLGHLHIADQISQQLNMAQIRFIPCKTPVLKARATATPKQRLQMLNIALAHRDHYVIDTRELDRHTPSYMVETLSSLQKDFPEQALCLILGVDAFVDLPKWHQWQQLFGLCHIIVVTRPGFKLLTGTAFDKTWLPRKTQDINELTHAQSGKVFLLDMPPLPISSTEIRQCIKQHTENISSYLNPEVYDYIRQESLYG